MGLVDLDGDRWRLLLLSNGSGWSRPGTMATCASAAKIEGAARTLFMSNVAASDYLLSMIVCSFPNRNVDRSISMKLCSSVMKAALARRASSVPGAVPISTQASA